MSPMNPFRSISSLAPLLLALALGSVPARGGDTDCLGRDPLSDQGILELVPGASIDAVLARYGFERLDWIPGTRTYLVSLENQIREDAFELLFLTDTDIDHSELNFLSGDPGPGTQSIFLFAPPSAYELQPVLDTLGVSQAQKSATGAGVRVAVIDSGVDPSHPELIGRIAPDGAAFIADEAQNDQAAYTDLCNGVDDDGDGLLDEGVGHGTAVAALVTLVAPGAEILPIKVLDDEGVTTAFRVAKGIHYAIDHGARVINLSLSTCADLRIIDRALNRADEHGIVVVAAAGNSSSDSEIGPEFPAASNRAFGIAATNQSGALASFSNYGRDYIAAAPGIDLVSATPASECGDALPRGTYGNADGTSFAAPLASGMAAMLIERGTVIRGENFRDAIRASAIDIRGMNPGVEDPVREGMIDIAAAAAWAGPCHADLTEDGVLGFNDVQLYLEMFALGDTDADFVEPRGFLNFGDVIAYLVYYTKGCP